MTLRVRPRHGRLARRLLVAQVLVIAAGGVTLAVVALVISPTLFRSHVQRALGPVGSAVGRHLDEAFQTSLLVSLGVGVGAAVAVALVVSWVLSSRIARPIESLSIVAERIARGELTARASAPPVDDELAELTGSFNAMAAALEHTEDTRSRLLSDLAHELRTPLSTIRAYLEGLADGVVDPDAQTLETLRDATDRLHRLVDDVALVSRAEEGALDLDRVLVPVGRLVGDAVTAAADAYRQAGVDLVAEVPAGLPAVDVDPDRIHQVLGNLLGNARRHTPEGGRVTVRAGESRDAVVIEVADTGEGIAPEQLLHVFERFYRGDSSRQHAAGSGIGLTIARAIVRAHGGELTAASPGAGEGTTVTLRLPSGSGAPTGRTSWRRSHA